MTFENLNLKPVLLKAIQQCGYLVPTPIQLETIPKILDGHDVIASANTGTGKTASFVLPALQNLLTPSLDKKKAPSKGQPSVLILTPTRELANQVSQAIRNYGRFVRFQSVTLFGGMPYGPQLKSLSRHLDIVVATPGRLIDLLDRGNIDLSAVKMLVLDEADRMLDMGFIDEVNKIADLTPTDRQTLFFTATWDNTLAALARRLLKDPQRIQIETQHTQVNIAQHLHLADDFAHKKNLLQHLIQDVQLKQAIIFSATKQGADSLAQELIAQGYAAAALHGDMKQALRNRTLMNLRQGKLRLLVATDVAARGIDVTSISHVINFDFPKFAEDYVHRIGRTGRAGAPGTAISFILPDDLPHLDRLERYTGTPLLPEIIPGLEPTRPLHVRRMSGKKKNLSRAPAGAPGRRSFYSAPKSRQRYQQPTPHHQHSGRSTANFKKASTT